MSGRIATAIAGLFAGLTAIVLTTPGAIASHRAAGEAQLEARALNEDIAFLEMRSAADPRNWFLAGHLAARYLDRFRSAADLHDLDHAERLVRSTLLLRLDPAGGEILLSNLLLSQHRFSEAYDAARRATDLAPRDDAALGVLVDAARATGEDSVGNAAWNRMEEGTFARAVRSPSSASPEDARQRVRAACMRLEERNATRELRAWCVTRLAALEPDRDAKKRRLREALRIQPGHRGALEASAELAYAEGEWVRAHRLYARIVSDAHPDLWLRLAELSRLLGRTAEAESHERRFARLASDPGREALFGLELAMHRARKGQCSTALRLASAELSRRRSVEAFESAAWVSYLCGDSARANTLLAEAGHARITATGRYLAALLSGAPAIRADVAALAPYALYHYFARGRRA